MAFFLLILAVLALLVALLVLAKAGARHRTGAMVGSGILFTVAAGLVIATAIRIVPPE